MIRQREEKDGGNDGGGNIEINTLEEGVGGHNNFLGGARGATCSGKCGLGSYKLVSCASNTHVKCNCSADTALVRIVAKE